MGDSTDWMEGKNTLEQYFKLLCQIKEIKPKKDCVWISFWEGMHRHAALIMALLNAKLSHDTNKCYVPNTLEKNILPRETSRDLIRALQTDRPASSTIFLQDEMRQQKCSERI